MVSSDLPREAQLRLHLLSSPEQAMAVRFDLSSEEQDRQQDQDHHLDLCVIKYGSNGVLEVSPDFTSGKQPYRVEVR